MQRRPFFWLLVSLLCFGGSIYFWRQGDAKWHARQNELSSATNQVITQPAAPSVQPATPTPIAKPTASTPAAKSRFPYRLTNTDKTTGQMLRNNKAIHLANALIDTSKPLDLGIPDRLRAPKDNGSYVVQARGPLDDAFRTQLREAGASIVSYIPNNAYLVRVSEGGAQQLAASAQSVLPYEPYYKLDSSLLKSVMGEQEISAMAIKVTLFPDASATIFDSLNIRPTAVDRSPFGPVVTIPVASLSALVSIANLPGVQAIAPSHSRVYANDLTRPRLGVSVDSLTNTPSYLGLSGSNIVININDSGVDATHPDLAGRIFGAGVDTDGHGTHVAGTILGSGFESSTVTNASGSIIPGASFRGMATNATAFVISLGSQSDSGLQEQAALTNAIISNNSWNYGDAAYDIEAASYDAAVRDALPQAPGSQQIVYVFSAGNDGGGSDGGQNGSPDGILSPGTAKNVITVGAIEQLRNITNVVVENDSTNQDFLPSTDSSTQVASFSSRGNVGISVEGNTGRFKPDVVAPGTFVISTRSSMWDTNSYYHPTNHGVSIFQNQTVDPNGRNVYLFSVPPNVVQLTITVLTNEFSPSPFPSMPIYGAINVPANTNTDFIGTNQVFLPTNSITLNAGDTLFYSIANGTNTTVDFDLRLDVLETNADYIELAVLEGLNDSISAAPQYYRYESGTSMAAAGVSGMLACMEEFFQQQLKISNASPALMKALLINGARSVTSPGQPYDFQVANSINFQGWGLPNLSNSIPSALTNFVSGGAATMPVLFFDQDPTNALATGQGRTRKVQLSANAMQQPLRITLVWTDPPGNPTAGVKLVNDLDLIVINLDTGDVYYGNDIPGGSVFNQISDTNSPPAFDSVNNVENVFLPQSTGTNFAITVYGHHVNVNAVTANTNNVVQDYALVISSGDALTSADSPLTLTDNPVVSSNNVSPVNTLTNGFPLLNQRIGANSQYASTTNGITNQWNFYVFTNTASLTNGSFTNVAFVTFSPPNLGVPRMGASGEINPTSTNATRYAGADVDLYVSTDPGLTNLNQAVIAAANKSVGRTGDEVVVFSNSAPGQVYYIGVKSEDQQGAEYGFFGAASNIPFDQTDPNGNEIINMFPLPAVIPGGTASSPKYAFIIGVGIKPSLIRNVTASETVTHQNFGDLIGTLSHKGIYTVLNNHTSFTNFGDASETFTYDDSGEGNTPNSHPSDGPGTLRSYVGTQSSGAWIFSMVNDSSLIDLGQIDNFQLTIEPQPPTTGVQRTLLGNAWFYDFIDVPADCTNLTVSVLINGANPAPLELYVRRGAFPTLTQFDKSAVINPPGGSLSISSFDSPPLNPGRYFIAVHNPNVGAVSFFLSETLGLSLTGAAPYQFISSGSQPILDDAVTYSTNHVGVSNRVVSAEVGVRIDHPRISDLVLTLVSPQGTRVLLAENRGGLSTNYGVGVDITNTVPSVSAGDANASTQTIALPAGQTMGTLVVSYNFYEVPDSMHVYYGGVKIFDSGYVSDSGTFAIDFGPGTATNIVIIMNEGGNPHSTAWDYSAVIITKGTTYAIFTDDTNKTTLPIKFAVPPFGAGAAFTAPQTVMTSGFEVTATNYAAPATVDGWTVLNSNPVMVVSVPVLASSGNNVLALHQGSIARTLPTVAGTSYTLTFASHGQPVDSPISWWKAESNYVDSVSTNNGTPTAGTVPFTTGEVGNSFNVNSGYVDVGTGANLRIQNFTIDCWIRRSNAGALSTGSPDATLFGFGANGYELAIRDPGNPFLTHVGINGTFDFQNAVTGTNIFHHVAVTKNGANVIFYVDGTASPTANYTDVFAFSAGNRVAIGRRSDNNGNNFLGIIDEVDVFGGALSTLQIQDIYAAGSAGKRLDNVPEGVTMTLGGLVTNIFSGDGWTTNGFVFTATGNNMTLQFTPLQDGVLLDSFTLVANPVANPTNYYLPEEPLAKLIGERTQGDWKLEILDNRAGPTATNPAPILGSWQLNLIAETVVPTAIPLSHAISVSNSVATNSIVYFSVQVPSWARFATNTVFNVSGGSVNLLFNQNFLPGASTNTGDQILFTTSSSNRITLATNLVPTPPLVPGQTYYLGVQNLSASTVTFSIEVDFDITTLTNMIPVTSTLAASSVPRYFQYDVSTNAVAVTFQLLNLSGNVDLVARRGPPLPDLTAFNYISAFLGTNNESIIVLTNSAPVFLTPGRWYLGVFNSDSVPVNYTILATEYGPPIIIPLTNGIPATNVFPPGPSLSTFYSFTITNTNSAVLFELYNLSGNADLNVDRGVGNYPYSSPYYASSTQPGNNIEQIVLRTNILGTNIQDIFYLGVPNPSSTNVAFTIRAVVDTNNMLVPGLPINVTITNSPGGPTFTWPTVAGESYEVVTSPSLLIPTSNWMVLAIISNAPPYLDSYIDTNYSPLVPYMFFRILQIPTP